MESLTYKIDTFEGPLDLLLTLIMKNKMDILDIQISVIFEQYMAYLSELRQMNMEVAGEFIVMASELMYIKSRMLLPRTDENEEDPRERLAQALIEYKRAKEAAVYLQEQFAVYGRRMVKETDEIPSEGNYVAPQDIRNLEEAVRRLLVKKEREKEPPIANIQPIIQKTIVPVSEKIKYLLHRLHGAHRVPFETLFDEAKSKSEIVAIFIAVLALIKDGHIALERELQKTEKPQEADAAGIEGANDAEDTSYAYRYTCALVDEELEDTSAYDEFDS